MMEFAQREFIMFSIKKANAILKNLLLSLFNKNNLLKMSVVAQNRVKLFSINLQTHEIL